jgi:hypothetical protein
LKIEIIKLKLNYCNLIAATTELLNITVNNLVKINAELSNVKSDLTNKLEGILNYLEIGENCIPKRCVIEH